MKLLPVFLSVNSGHARQAPHDGVITSSMLVPVTLIADKTPVNHNGNMLLTIIDAIGRQHLVDEWYLIREGDSRLSPSPEQMTPPRET